MYQGVASDETPATSDEYMKEFEVKKTILDLFGKSGGGFVSGEEISDRLGFSRAYAWKYINKLRDEGYVFEAIPHKGYKLRSSPDKIYGYDLSRGLDTKIIGKRNVYHYEKTGSTNDKAYELAEKGEPEGAIIIAETQTRGKGRMGREWISPGGGGMYFSLILRPGVAPDRIPAITLIASMSVVKAIKSVCGLDAQLRWPNDILLGQKKICGILTEIKAQPDMVDFLVLGVGLNVNTDLSRLPRIATSLKAENGAPVNRLELLKCILTELEKDYSVFITDGFTPLRGRYKRVSSVLGRHIRIKERDLLIEGKAVDVDEKGALIVKTVSGTLRRVFSGDVTLCRKV